MARTWGSGSSPVYRASGRRATSAWSRVPVPHPRSSTATPGRWVLPAPARGHGGIADLAWHEVFGVEVALDALVSPSHVPLAAGGLLILTSPLRAHGVLSRASGGT